MSKEMKVTCDFVQNSLVCELPPHTLDLILKVHTRSGEHTFKEDIYTRTMKYRRWNNQMRPFRSLKKRVANIFQSRRSSSNDSWEDSTQTVVNQPEAQSETNSSVHSEWSEPLLVNDNPQPSTSNSHNKNDELLIQSTPTKKTLKNIVLVPYKPKPKSWGSWCVKTPNTTTTSENPIENLNENIVNTEYVPHSPYYSPVHSPQFYETE